MQRIYDREELEPLQDLAGECSILMHAVKITYIHAVDQLAQL